jgi:monoamine oxidase
MARLIALAADAERRGVPTRLVLEERALRRVRGSHVGRRTFLKAAGAAGAAMSLAPSAALAAPARPTTVAVVGAGLAGLSCADRLAAKGLTATLYDATTRAGGRCASLSGTFPGQIVERGGELIDNLHKTMLGFAKRYRLTLEDYEKQPGDVFYRFGGGSWSEDVIVDEYRSFVASMRADLRTLSSEPTADDHTDADAALDQLSLADYLVSRRAGPLVSQAIEAAYLAEYGLEIGDQSALNLLLFIHADKRSRFMPFGVFSDERYHIVEGNDRIALGLEGDLLQPVKRAHVLRRVARTAAGRIELTFDRAGAASPVVALFDHVVLTLPFTALRDVELAGSLDVPAWKRDAIDRLGYGTNAKTMVGFDGAYWRALGSSGSSYSDLSHHQATWETNPTGATPAHAVLTDYASGRRGATLDAGPVQQGAQAFLADLDLLFPGALAYVATDGPLYRVHREHWPSNPLTKGSYTCYRPGQFTAIAGREGRRIGNLHFAGEHANSFYEWQGFMEGACLSGLDAADEILSDVK